MGGFFRSDLHNVNKLESIPLNFIFLHKSASENTFHRKEKERRAERIARQLGAPHISAVLARTAQVNPQTDHTQAQHSDDTRPGHRIGSL